MINPIEAQNKKRILLVDDHALMRAGIRALLDEIGDFDVIGESGNGIEALELVRKFVPDLLLLDISLPGLNGLEVLRQIGQQYPDVRVLMLSMHAGSEYVARALSFGASGYLLKDSAFDELAAALHAIACGRDYLCAAIDTETVQRFIHSAQQGQSEQEILTPRQRQILQQIAEGFGPRDIAESLNVSVKTVEAHRAQLMERLGIHHVPGLVRFAIRIGLVSPDL
ncbi:response regulator transcription factor [Microbulbifer pacificus]|uniref:Response regulator transcription factor n=1 Tax=Microbulbifer pacificus TaxID=407164 RepID=A0AAU0MXR5_9GAMM|nr:response regulator transcription factor [Microbulbifer pacificus]WOX04603.1 response regulator transcription factor [Microbulbifer pacificus]